tara:strand:+ start:817 stop:1410 length:594 start_codon:yes stop_codon:yes gene_type:complete
MGVKTKAKDIGRPVAGTINQMGLDFLEVWLNESEDVLNLIDLREGSSDIKVRILPSTEFQQVFLDVYRRPMDKRIKGYALSTKPISSAVIADRSPTNVLMVLGHEVGHLLAPILEHEVDEEAKAMIFGYAWCQAMNRVSPPIHPFSLDNYNQGFHELSQEEPPYSDAYRLLRPFILANQPLIEVYNKIADKKITSLH